MYIVTRFGTVKYRWYCCKYNLYRSIYTFCCAKAHKQQKIYNKKATSVQLNKSCCFDIDSSTYVFIWSQIVLPTLAIYSVIFAGNKSRRWESWCHWRPRTSRCVWLWLKRASWRDSTWILSSVYTWGTRRSIPVWRNQQTVHTIMRYSIYSRYLMNIWWILRIVLSSSLSLI